MPQHQQQQQMKRLSPSTSGNFTSSSSASPQSTSFTTSNTRQSPVPPIGSNNNNNTSGSPSHVNQRHARVPPTNSSSSHHQNTNPPSFHHHHSSKNNSNNANKLWDKIILVLAVMLVLVLIGFVGFFTYAHTTLSSSSSSDDNDASAEARRARNELMNRMIKEHRVVEHKHEEVTLAENNNNNDASISDHNNDNNNINNEKLQQHDDKHGQLLVAPTTSSPTKLSAISKPSQSEKDTFWKISCVGKSRPASSIVGDMTNEESGDDKKSKQKSKKLDAFRKQHQLHLRDQSASCIFNIELFDKRDLVSPLNAHKNHLVDPLHHHHGHGNNNNHANNDDDDPDHNFKKIRKIGDGIRRKHRAVPDDALVEDNLFERKLSVLHADDESKEDQQQKEKDSSASEASASFISVEAPDSAPSSSLFIGKDSPSFIWVHQESNVKVEMTSDLNSNNKNNHDKNNNEFTSTFKFLGAEKVKFFGLGNRGSSIELPDDGHPIRLKNLDINHYTLDPHISLYGTVPLVYAALQLPPKNKNQKHHHVLYVGIFYLNGATMSVTAKSREETISFHAEGGGVRVFFLPGPNPTSILRQYYQLTGAPNFPPLFSLGYHQSRWTYRDQQDIIQIHENFDKNQLPLDVLWLDIDHTNGLRYFTWDTRKFPDPEKMQYKLFDESGRRMVTITDPHIKHDRSYHVFSQGSSGHHFVTHRDGRDFYGHCWPGQSAWIDYLKEDTRSWYASLFRYGSYHGSTPYLCTWNDMNEPSVFSGPDLTFPMDDAAHFGGEVSHRDVHNVYGFYQSMATYAGLYERDLHLDAPIPARRPFALTRSYFAGSHRYAAVWTGDNQGKWDHLKHSFDMTLMMSISGISQVGADVGGFFDSTEHHLLASWYAAAVAYPFFRGHSHQDTERREPYLVRDQGGRITRALQLRYRVIPYLYTCFARLHFFSEPVMQPLFFSHDLGSKSSFVFGGGEIDGNEENNNHKEFNANSAEYFFWGHALMWRPFVEQHELHNLHSHPSVEICSQNGEDDVKDSRNLLWMSESSFAIPELHRRNGNNKNPNAIPNFVSWCSMQWINPFTQPSTCKLYPNSCETPVFQRSETIVVTTAYPSLRYDVSAYDDDNEKENNNNNVVSSIPRPKSTEDLLPRPAEGEQKNQKNEKKNRNTKKRNPVGLEIRAAFSLDMDVREGDLLAHGSHFIDSNGENEISTKSSSSSADHKYVKYCMMSWSLSVVKNQKNNKKLGLSLCSAISPEDLDHHLPRPSNEICYAEMKRMKRAVLSIHSDPDKKSNEDANNFIETIQEVTIVSSSFSGHHHHSHKSDVEDGDEKKKNTKRSFKIRKTKTNPESHLWEVPLSSAAVGGEENTGGDHENGFEVLGGGEREWCVLLQ